LPLATALLFSQGAQRVSARRRDRGLAI